MSILRVRDKDGNVTDIPAIRGKTPVKGVDYFTEADKEELVAAVLAELPTLPTLSSAEEASF